MLRHGAARRPARRGTRFEDHIRVTLVAMTVRDKLALLEQRREESEQGGGPPRTKAQHNKGKLSPRERLDVLLDDGTFVELDRFVTHRSTDFGLDKQKIFGDGVVT